MKSKSMQEEKSNSYLFGSNAGFIEELYDKYLIAPQELEPKWKKYFDSLQDSKSSDVSHEQVKEKFAILTQTPNFSISAVVDTSSGEINLAQIKVFELISSYRKLGSICANLDPLERKPVSKIAELDLSKYGLSAEINNEFYVDTTLNKKAKLKDIVVKLDAIYCNKAGFEFSHITDTEEEQWLTNYVETNYLSYQLSNPEKVQLLQKLTEADTLERFLHTKYVGQKRFSLEGGDSLIPALDRLINTSAKNGVKDLIIGMAHRGRLNTLVNITGKAPQKLFDEFDGNYPSYDFVVSGDVKYHKGYKCNYQTDNGKVKVTLAFNPSHLEVVNPVVNGAVRAIQDKTNDKNAVMGVLIHGDSAISGLGTNQGVLNMSQTRAYGVDGMVHIIVNNQVGFTTSDVRDNRSSRFCSDIAKMIESPIIHVNADDVESVAFVMDLSSDYRTKFKKDIMIDLVCFRRYGHNEADDPTLTQPLMYSKIKQHPGTRSLYADKLVAAGVIAKDVTEKMAEDYRTGLSRGVHIGADKMEALKWYDGIDLKPIKAATANDKINTILDKQEIAKITEAVTAVPDGFNLHPTLKRLLDTRRAMGNGEQPIDFGMAETLAYGSLLQAGVSIRITGEDTGRGTFVHRQAVWHDAKRDDLSDSGYIPLTKLENKSKFNIYDSVLNEECVLGFEYGYSTVNLHDLVIWEAQFGDFANGAQVIIDQFIASGEVKWGVLNDVTLLLPHGYEGQGPEHSSARIERFLQLCAENNMQVVRPSTAAQMFHLLRHKALSNWIKPLVIFMSKKLLRYKDAMSDINDFTNGGFKTIIADPIAQAKACERVIVCSGSVYYDLIDERKNRELNDKVAIIRVEQLYPFPLDVLHAEVAKYSKAHKFIWAQEEPYNQGAWLQIRDGLDAAIGKDSLHTFESASRPAAAAPATGITSMHEAELKQLLLDAFE
jgi:2-oxoglutarate dehydrogenase E1 component